MLLKNLTGLLLLAVLHAGAQASVITSTVHGVITGRAVDTAGLFGQAGASLEGLAFSSTVRYTRPAHADDGRPHSDDYHPSGGTAPLVSFNVVVNKRTFARQFQPQYFFHGIQDAKGGRDDLLMDFMDASVAMEYQIFTFVGNFVSPFPTLESTLSYRTADTDTARAGFRLRGSTDPLVPGETYFYTRITQVDLNVAPQDVPEPSTPALFLLALAAAGVVAARKRAAGERS